MSFGSSCAGYGVSVSHPQSQGEPSAHKTPASDPDSKSKAPERQPPGEDHPSPLRALFSRSCFTAGKGREVASAKGRAQDRPRRSPTTSVRCLPRGPLTCDSTRTGCCQPGAPRLGVPFSRGLWDPRGCPQCPAPRRGSGCHSAQSPAMTAAGTLTGRGPADGAPIRAPGASGPSWSRTKASPQGLPWWRSGWESAC